MIQILKLINKQQWTITQCKLKRKERLNFITIFYGHNFTPIRRIENHTDGFSNVKRHVYIDDSNFHCSRETLQCPPCQSITSSKNKSSAYASKLTLMSAKLQPIFKLVMVSITNRPYKISTEKVTVYLLVAHLC